MGLATSDFPALEPRKLAKYLKHLKNTACNHRLTVCKATLLEIIKQIS